MVNEAGARLLLCGCELLRDCSERRPPGCLDTSGKPGATTSYTENSTVQPVEPKRVLYSYYTAGSGGVGPTILETSLLLAGTPVTVYANGEKVSALHAHGGSPTQPYT